MSRYIWMLLVLAAACGGSAVTAPSAEVGSYALVSLDGRAVPTTIMEGGVLVTVTSGSTTLSAGGALQMSVSFQPSGQAAAVNSLTGQYTRQGNQLSFSYSNGGRDTGTISGDTLTMANEGVIWLFLRR